MKTGRNWTHDKVGSVAASVSEKDLEHPRSQLEIKRNYSPPPNIHLQRSQNTICHSVSSHLNHARSASVFFQARERVSSVEYMINPLSDCIRCLQLPWRRESALIGVSAMES
ncbi:hypothetical protein CEXT_658151 [Caerostris extrusa]|uniref:Uncharacterized protein n=1 Tax=Caerostris extrusa TaxID=172846 RepID=A0AAV4S4Y3_CAEEX|nr:hypothetical protein CEXT_658151 [Caerostris extrusa]